jgi:tetratricopeptide (TPR) repeat protein
MSDTSPLPAPTPERRRIAAGKFERASQVAATGNHDYAIKLLQECCVLDPANLIYRKALRQTQRLRLQDQGGGAMAFLTTGPKKLRLQAALRTGDHLKVLEYGEHILTTNPWDLGTHVALAESFTALKLPDQAIWCLEMVRSKKTDHKKTNRLLARLYEQRGNFTQAITLWEWLRKQDPADQEAAGKAQEIAAKATIARGGYEQVIAGTRAAAAKGEEAPAPGLTETATNQAAGTAEQPAIGGSRVAREAAPLLAKIEANPTSPHVYLQLAQLYRKSDMPDEARKVLQQGLAPTANSFELAVALADLEIESFRQNLTEAEERLKRDPKNEELKKVRAKLLREINTRELQLFQQKAARYPTELGHRFELGVRLLRANQLDEAIRELQAARADPRHHYKALYYLGFCFKNRNNWKLAQRNFEEALKDLPPSEESMRKELMFQLAQGAADAGDLNKAVEVGMELANVDFSYKDIGRLLDDWQSRAPA